jgi:hypothetical protein
MNEQNVSTTPIAAPTPFYRAPWLGVLAFAGVLLWKPVAHSMSVLLEQNFPGNAGYLAGGLIGLLGAVLVWKGLRQQEHMATCLGFLGGVLIWRGWMESALRLYAEEVGVLTLVDSGGRLGVRRDVLFG